MIEIEKAQEILCEAMRICLETVEKDDSLKKSNTNLEEVDLWSAEGRVLAEDLCAEMDQPPYPRAPLDGYAFRGEDSEGADPEHPIRLKVVGKIFAGEVYSGEIHHGEALRLMTGSPIPYGANAVIRQEDTDFAKKHSNPWMVLKETSEESEEETFVELYKEIKPYQNYCEIGEDYKKGTILLKKGTCIHAGAIGIAASLGRTKLPVFCKPSIAVISTGDEVIAPGEPLRPGKIYDSNRYYMTARLAEFGCRPEISVHCEDKPENMAEWIKKASKTCRLIITTGGVSVGEKDIMHETADLLGAELLFWKVRIKPGSPTMAFCYENTLVIALSGNPFGAIANLELLVRPVLGTMLHTDFSMSTGSAILSNGFVKPSGTRRFLRSFYQDGMVEIGGRKQVSGAISAMADCNCFVEITPEMTGVKPGDHVRVFFL